MIIPIILLGFAVFIVVLGRPVADVESLYYDAEFEEFTSFGEESSATEESSEDTGDNEESEDVDIEKLARSIYDGVDL